MRIILAKMFRGLSTGVVEARYGCPRMHQHVFCNKRGNTELARRKHPDLSGQTMESVEPLAKHCLISPILLNFTHSVQYG